MGRMKEMWLEQYIEEDGKAHFLEERAVAKPRAAASAEAGQDERDWAAQYPAEWGEWVRLLPLTPLTFDFGSGESYDFPQFLSEVGPRPSPATQSSRETKPFPTSGATWSGVRPRGPRPPPVPWTPPT